MCCQLVCFKVCFKILPYYRSLLTVVEMAVFELEITRVTVAFGGGQGPPGPLGPRRGGYLRQVWWRRVAKN